MKKVNKKHKNTDGYGHNTVSIHLNLLNERSIKTLWNNKNKKNCISVFLSILSSFCIINQLFCYINLTINTFNLFFW